MFKKYIKIFIGLTLIALLVYFFLPSVLRAGDSTCYGTPKQGSIVNAWRLPIGGSNYKAYSYLGILLGRTYVHHKVYQSIVATYDTLAKKLPDTVFIYGETGLKSGGKFYPHITHRNGLSVDFMVPIKNAEGKSLTLPTHALNQYGYDVEFNEKGKIADYEIDFEAMAEHLRALKKSTQEQGVGIKLVVFAPELRKLLLATQAGRGLEKIIPFSKTGGRVRHDEHYHVDFLVECKK